MAVVEENEYEDLGTVEDLDTSAAVHLRETLSIRKGKGFTPASFTHCLSCHCFKHFSDFDKFMLTGYLYECSDPLHFVILQLFQFIAWMCDMCQNKKSMAQSKSL
jgi:hypothetical protein